MKWGKASSSFYRDDKIQQLLHERKRDEILLFDFLLREAWSQDNDPHEGDFTLKINLRYAAAVLTMLPRRLNAMLTVLEQRELLIVSRLNEQLSINFPNYAKYKDNRAFSSTVRPSPGSPAGSTLGALDKKREEKSIKRPVADVRQTAHATALKEKLGQDLSKDFLKSIPSIAKKYPTIDSLKKRIAETEKWCDGLNVDLDEERLLMNMKD